MSPGWTTPDWWSGPDLNLRTRRISRQRVIVLIRPKPTRLNGTLGVPYLSCELSIRSDSSWAEATLSRTYVRSRVAVPDRWHSIVNYPRLGVSQKPLENER